MPPLSLIYFVSLREGEISTIMDTHGWIALDEKIDKNKSNMRKMRKKKGWNHCDLFIHDIRRVPNK
jgi:hypothetical protein